MLGRVKNQPPLDNPSTFDEDKEADDESCSSASSSGSDSDSEEDSNNRDETEVSTGRLSDTTNDSAAEIGRKGTRNLCRLRWVVLLTLMLSTVVLAALAENSTKKKDYDHFEAQFSEHAFKILDSFSGNLEHGIDGVDSLAVSITSYTDSVNQEFPYITIPQFDIRAASTRKIANAALISFVPTVEGTLRSSWEQFVLQETSPVADQTPVDDESGGLEEEVTSRMEGILQDFFDRIEQTNGTLVNFTQGVSEKVYRMDGVHKIIEDGEGPYYPLWQHSPPAEVVNFNLVSHEDLGSELLLMADSRQVVVGKIVSAATSNDPFEDFHHQGPVGTIYFPVFDSFADDRELVGLLMAIVRWTDYLQTTNLPTAANGISIVLRDGCGQTITFRVVDEEIAFQGDGDLHDVKYDDLEESLAVALQNHETGGNDLTYSGASIADGYCQYSVHVYPAPQVEAQYTTTNPGMYAGVVVVVFVFMSCALVYYDTVVERSHQILIRKAQRSHYIVSSLFPSTVRDRVFGNSSNEGKDELPQVTAASQPLRKSAVLDKVRVKSFINTGGINDDSANKPIADLFARCTCLFADISGFTAWSSAREPAQVFVLLESVYSTFDKIAGKRRVFKVETIGDCYVAVTGLPDPQPDHVTLMVKFARECLAKFVKLTRNLEKELGPDTGDLCMRFGLHSGPVTAGVLRGQKARFQLFGDTVNTASRMESTGEPNRIHCSEATATLLREAGKGDWLHLREDPVKAKGKGTLQTFWVNPMPSSSSTAGSNTSSTCSSTGYEEGLSLRIESLDVASPNHARHQGLSSHDQRLIGWTVDLLASLLKGIVAKRQNEQGERTQKRRSTRSSGGLSRQVLEEVKLFDEQEIVYGNQPSVYKQPREEYVEVDVITIPPIHSRGDVKPESVQLDPIVLKQLRHYVTTIASSYHQNAFHNFDHACHVALSVNKLLKRISQAEDQDENSEVFNAADISKYASGISSDPLTLFSCVFAAMIHDVDHVGLGNFVLMKEKDELAEFYGNQSILEQNSIDVAWELLMDPAYEQLRDCIYSTEDELRHFRMLVVNLVMATDIFDKDLLEMRNNRWQKAFDDHVTEDRSDLKATIVLEHIIQASDVCHTMQHWHIYQKWNERFFMENYSAFQEGRVEKNPADGWYGGELWFYDNYIIPLAKKLQECQVFGASSDEFLTYATDNRDEWKAKGEAIVESFVEKAKLLREEPETELPPPSLPMPEPDNASDLEEADSESSESWDENVDTSKPQWTVPLPGARRQSRKQSRKHSM